jgi:hypothetical protein
VGFFQALKHSSKPLFSVFRTVAVYGSSFGFSDSGSMLSSSNWKASARASSSEGEIFAFFFVGGDIIRVLFCGENNRNGFVLTFALKMNGNKTGLTWMWKVSE